MPNAKKYRLVPNKQFLQILQSAGIDGFEVEVNLGSGTGGGSRAKAGGGASFVIVIPQGVGCFPFTRQTCTGGQFFDKKASK